eukprot:733973-Karenia_brevis.AAC.1
MRPFNMSKAGLSDHALARWTFCNRRAKPKQHRPIPSWATKSKEFAILMRRAARKTKWDALPPFEALE